MGFLSISCCNSYVLRVWVSLRDSMKEHFGACDTPFPSLSIKKRLSVFQRPTQRNRHIVGVRVGQKQSVDARITCLQEA